MEHPRLICLSTWLAFLLSSVAIAAAATGDLWLDEIWSLSFARGAKSIVDIVSRFRHDNNHPLNTLFLYCVGDQKALLVYRLHSVLAGVGSLLLCGYVARRDWGHTEALCSTVLMGMSFPLLLYLSEARGYALAILFGLASYATLGQTSPRRWLQLTLFWSSSVLGILSHASFVMLSVGFVLWSAACQAQLGAGIGRAAQRLAVLHAPPLLFFAWWYVFFLKDMTIGGGPQYGTWSVIGQASVLILGLPDVPTLRAVAPFLVLLLVALGSASLRQQHDTRWIFFPAVLVISPTLILLVGCPEYLYFRYFVVCFPFCILLLAHLVVRGFHSSPRHWRWLSLVALLGLLAGQVPRDYRLLTLGRGQYAAALQFIADRSPKGQVLVGSDQDFRNGTLFDFYAPRTARGSSLRYVERAEWEKEPPDWILVSQRPPEEIAVNGVGRYRLIKEYEFSGISGSSWFLFRRVG